MLELLQGLSEPRTPRGHGIHDLIVDFFHVDPDSLTWALAGYNANAGDYQPSMIIMAFSPTIPEDVRDKCNAMRSSLAALGVGASYPQDVVTMCQATDKLLEISADDGTLLHGPMLTVEAEKYETHIRTHTHHTQHIISARTHARTHAHTTHLLCIYLYKLRISMASRSPNTNLSCMPARRPGNRNGAGSST